MLDRILKDIETARENHYEYMRMQSFFKGQFAEPKSVIEFMELDYVPTFLKKFFTSASNCMNKFFAWWLDFHRLSFLTVMMITAIIILIIEALK